MRRTTLNKQDTPKALRLVLIVITMLLLPSTAWGELYQSGEYNSTNSTWGAWTLNSVDGVSFGNMHQLILTVAAWNSKTVTITLPKPSEGAYVIQSINLEIPSSDYLSIQTATMNGDNISGNFSLDNQESPQANSYTPKPPIDWTGDIVITLVGDNTSSESKTFVLVSASVYATTKNTATFSWPDAVSSANDYDVSGISKSVNEGTGAITLSGHCKEGTKYSFALTPSEGTHTIRYTSSNPDNAAIDESTGVVTVRQTGTFTISASLTTEGVYYSTNSYSYTLNITEIDIPYNLTVAGVEVTSGNKADIFGNGTVSFDSENNKLTLNQATIKGIIESSNDLVVHLIGSNTISDFGNYPFFYYNTGYTLAFTQEKVEIDNSPIFGSLKAIYGNSSSFSWINEPSANTISTTFETEKKTGWFQESNENEKYSIIKYVEYYDLSLNISIEGWTFGDTPNAPTLEGNAGGGTVTWKYKYPDSDNFVETAPTSDSPAGEYTVKAEVAETGNYLAGSAEKTFTIAQLDISDAVVTLDNTELIYNGQEQTVSVQKVMVGDDVVPQDYYEVSGNTGTEIGNYSLTVTAKTRDSQGNLIYNNYTGTATKEWKITNHPTASASELGFNTETQTFSTYYNPNEDFNLPDGYVAYIITGIDGSKVLTTRISYIPKGVAVLVEKGSSSEETIEEIPSELPLKGTTEPLDVTSITGGTVYVLYNGMFVKSTSGTIPEKRCYLLIDTNVAAGTRGFIIDHGEGSSALRGVTAEGTHGKSDAWYTLQGRRLSAKPSAPGLYLRNGVKVVIK